MLMNKLQQTAPLNLL